MKNIFGFVILCACSLGGVSFADQPKQFTALVLPDKVTLGMSKEELQGVRPDTKKLTMMIGSKNPKATVVTEITRSDPPFVLYYYHFIEDRLRAVTYGIGYYGKRDEKTIERIHDALRRDLVKKSDEDIVRFDKKKQIQVDAELWMDQKSETGVYFVDAPSELTVITFDPKYFGKKDFFMTADEMQKLAPEFERAEKMIEDSKKLKK